MISESSENEQRPIASSGGLLSIRNIMIAILAWGAFHTIGVYVFSQKPDVRKPLIVYSTVLLFLGCWKLLLWQRGRSIRALDKKLHD